MLGGELELISHGLIKLDIELARAFQGHGCVYTTRLLNRVNDVAHEISFGLLHTLADLVQVIFDQPHNEQALSGPCILRNIPQLVANARIQDDVELASVHFRTPNRFPICQELSLG